MKLSKIVVIATDAHLAEQVCGRFRSPRTYLVAIEMPKERLVEYGVYKNDCIRVANIVEAVEPDYVLFLGCSDAALRAVQAHFDDSRKVIALNAFDESALNVLPGFRSKRVSASAWDGRAPCRGEVIVVEETNTVASVIAENLAVAQSALLHVMPAPTADVLDASADHLRDWAELDGIKREEAKSKLMETIRTRIGPLADVTPSCISFFTQGIPYGVHPFRCPTTHFFSKHLVGISVVTGLLKSLMLKLRSPVVVLIDPGRTEKSEFDSLRGTFGKRGYLIRRAFKEAASVTKSRYLTEYMPCDYIFYSTHCGERPGRRITELFTTDDGREHEITYDILRDAAPSPTPGIIEVHSFQRPISLDGVQWDDPVGKQRIGAGEILKQFIKVTRENRADPRKMRIKASSESPPIRASDSLGMYDGAYRPVPQIVGGYHMPVVFNNACSSWREFAMEYASGGAAVYIGTSVPVLDSVAQKVSTKFAASVVGGRAAAPSLYQAQQSFIEDNGYAPYLMHGFAFTKIQPPPVGLPLEIIVTNKLKMVHQSCAKAAEANSADEKSKRGWDSVLHFLVDEIKSLWPSVRKPLTSDSTQPDKA
jgi:hypothetical protein